MEREDLIERSAEFLNEFYKDELLKAVNEGKRSVEVDFSLLDKFDVELADHLLENPEETISAMEEAVKQIDTGLSEAKIRLRFYNLPDTRNIRIRNIRSEHIGKLIVVDGIVKRASEVRPEVSEAIFQCPECGRNISIIQTERLVKPPIECECGNRKGFKLVDQKLYDARWIMVEEPYEIVSGERPSEIMIYLKEDLTSPKMQNKTDPGNRIRVVGVLKEIPRRVKGSRSRQMDIFIDANYVESVEAVWEELEITPEDEKRIVEAAKDPEVFNKLVASIAPSMYGLEDVKEAIILQLFGADPKVLKDKTRIRGNIHILLIGDPSSGKSQLMQLVSKLMPRGKYVSGSGVTAAGICTVYDTLVQFEDGTLKKIGEVVEEEFSKGFEKVGNGVYRAVASEERKIVSFNPETLKFEPRKVTHYWRIKAPSRLVKIKTRMGKEIITTLETPIPTIKDGKIRWVKAKDVKLSSFIVSPRIINVCPTTESLFSKIDGNAHILNAKTFIPKLVESIKERSTIREFCKNYWLNENDLYYNWKRKGNPTVLEIEKIARGLGIAPEEVLPGKLILSQYNGHRITLPLYPTEDLMYMTGLIAGDGSISRTNFGGFDTKLFNVHNQILKDFCLLCNEVLGIQPLYTEDRNGVPYHRFHSKIFANLLDKFGLPSGDTSHNIRIGEALSKLPNNLLAYYLRGIFDTDGSCMEGRGKRGSRIEFSSASKEFVQGLQVLLHRFGIISKVREKRPHASFIQGRKVKSGKNYVLEISGKENLEAFKRCIGFGLLEKSEKLERIVQSSSTHTNMDVLPGIGSLLRRLREELKLSAKEFYGYKCYHYEKGMRNPTRKLVTRILQKFGRTKSSTLEELKKILDSEIFWDRVVKVEVFNNKKYKYVYDLTVEGEHSFVANGLVIHNTATVVRDEEFLGGWVLEAGALVMANKSICCIDEFSKVSPQDRVALQEAMSLESYHPDTEITLLDGTSITIGEFVESLFEKYKNRIKAGIECLWLEVPEDIKILTTDFYRIYPTRIVRVSKHKAPDYFYKIKIATGRELIVTPNHPCFVFDGEIKCVDADKIKVGDYFPIPSVIPLEGTPQKFEIEESKVRSRLPFAKHIRIPMHNSTDFCKFLGYLVTEGCGYTTSGREYGICFTNSKDTLVEDFKFVTEKLFGLKPSKVREKEGVKNVYYNSVELFKFLQKIEPKMLSRSCEKQLPVWVKKLPKEEIKPLLRALFDSDGCTGNGYVYFTTPSKKLALQVQELLNILGVLSYLRRRLTKVNRTCWDLVIKGSENLKNFVNEVGFSDKEKNRKIVSYTKRATYRKNLMDSIPNVQDKVKHIMKGLKVYQKEVSGEILTRHFKHENNFTILVLGRVVKNLSKRVSFLEDVRKEIEKTVSRGELKKLRKKTRVSASEIAKEMGVCRQTISYLENKSKKFPLEKYKTALLKCVDRMLDCKKAVEELKRLVFSQIRWVPVTSVEKIENDGIEWVYDVTTENERFISNCMVLHNTISIAKASIVATLPAQTAILAGGNPKLGRFDPYIPIREQVDIDDVLLSRFDLKFALRDLPNPELDSKIADHILRMRQFEEETKPFFEPEFIRKWIAYARARIHPTLTPEAGNRLKEFYLEMRLKAGEEAPIAITLRQYEALLRLAEASARVRLSDKVEVEDAERAIRLMKVSLRQFGFEPETGRIDIDRAEGARVTSAQRSKIRIVLDVIEELGKTFGKEIPADEIIKRAKEQNVIDAEDILRKMQYEGIVYSPRSGFISKV